MRVPDCRRSRCSDHHRRILPLSARRLMTTGLSEAERQQIETTRKEIEGLRRERDVRLQQRDHALFGYLAGAGALGGLALGEQARPEVLLVVAYLAPAIAAIVAQHHSVIGRREAFISGALIPFLNKLDAAAPSPVGDKTRSRAEVRQRTLAHTMSLLLPALLGLAINIPRIDASWWIAAVCSSGTAAILWRSHHHRMRYLAGPEASLLARPGPEMSLPQIVSPEVRHFD